MFLFGIMKIYSYAKIRIIRFMLPKVEVSVKANLNIKHPISSRELGENK